MQYPQKSGSKGDGGAPKNSTPKQNAGANNISKGSVKQQGGAHTGQGAYKQKSGSTGG